MKPATALLTSVLLVAGCRPPREEVRPSAFPHVRIETTQGAFVLEVRPDWAPRGAERFLELVRTRFFDDSRFFRVRGKGIADPSGAGHLPTRRGAARPRAFSRPVATPFLRRFAVLPGPREFNRPFRYRGRPRPAR